MAVSLKTYFIPHTTRRKYGDFPTESISTSTTEGGGGAAGGGGGSSEYMTSFQTDNVSAGTWTVTGVYSLSNLLDGISIKVKFNTDSDSGLTANTIDLGIGAEGETGTTFPKPIYITPDQLVTDEIKEGDELMLTYRSSLSGWVIDGSNERFARDLWEFYDSGTIISKYNVASSGDVMAFGAEEYTGYTELSVIDDLTSTATTDALSANMGRVLAGMVDEKQDILESGVNIKTINNQSLLGSGNIDIQGGGGGTEYSGGTNIGITDHVISVTGTVQNAASATTANNAQNLNGHPESYYATASQITEIADILDDKYDKTGGTVNGNVIATGYIAASGDVMSYGASSAIPANLTVVDALTSTTTPHYNYALSAYQGKVLKDTKQDKLIWTGSTNNIKTINGQSLQGPGNLVIQGGGGTEYTGGTNIGISNYVISVTGTVQSAASATTAADSASLGGLQANYYARTNGNYSSMTAGTSNYAEKLGTSSAYYTKSSLDTAFNGKLGTGDTAANSDKVDGWHIVVGSIGSAANTLYFGY